MISLVLRDLCEKLLECPCVFEVTLTPAQFLGQSQGDAVRVLLVRPPAQAAAALQDGLVKEALGQVGQHHEVCRHGAGRLPGQSYVVLVPSKAFDILIDPLQGQELGSSLTEHFILWNIF